MSPVSCSLQNYFDGRSTERGRTRKNNQSSMVPVVLERRQRDDIMHRDLVHLVPNSTLAEAYQMWCLIVRRDYQGILYGSMDFGRLCRTLLDPHKQIQQRHLGAGLTSYKWDV